VNNSKILRDASEAMKDRPLTVEESAAARDALVGQMEAEHELVRQLVSAISADTMEGVPVSQRVQYAALALVIFKITGDVIELPEVPT